jgi:hypothetical protein
VATGVADNYLAMVLRSYRAADGSTPGKRTVALYTFDGVEGSALEADCTLPASQRAICVAALAFFLAQSPVGAAMTEAKRADVYAALTDFLAP